MGTISLCMIVKNEEENIKRCLASVKSIADEIIIVDTGSQDETKKEARAFTDKIYDFRWIDDFSAARNFSFQKAKMDYIMWMDADDVLLPEDAQRLAELKKTMDGTVDAYMLRYNTGFDARGNVTFSYYRERIVSRKRKFQWKEPVHEYLAVSGKTQQADIAVTHAKQKYESNERNLRIYENILKSKKNLSPRGMYYYARELKDHARYEAAAAQFRAFLDSGLGWREDNINACEELSKCLFQTGKDREGLLALLRSFVYDTPRAELCCAIGYYFKSKEDYERAAFWFRMILILQKPEQSIGFIRHDAWGFIPCIECAVCCDKLGNYQLAQAFNEQAAVFKPDAPEVAHNKKYFEEKIKQLQMKEEAHDVTADISDHKP